MRKQSVVLYFCMILAFLAFVGTNLYAQNGYKDYSWGMTIEQVKAKCPNIKYNDKAYWETPSFAYYYLYRDELQSYSSDPMQYEERTIAAYASFGPGEDPNFYFVNGKLVAVELVFAGEHIFQELQKQYGYATPIYWANGIIKHNAVAWHDSRNRFVVWNISYGLEFVTYINGEWLSPLLEKTIALDRQEREDVVSRLD